MTPFEYLALVANTPATIGHVLILLGAYSAGGLLRKLYNQYREGQAYRALVREMNANIDQRFDRLKQEAFGPNAFVPRTVVY